MQENVAVYLRKSRGDIEDLEKHKMQLLDICTKNNYDYDLYEEVCSGDLLDERPKMNQLLDNIKKYSRVLVVAIDRLSRNELHSALITQIFMENNILVETPSKIYNPHEENDILMSDFEKLLARSELRLTKKRLRQGKINGVKQGKFVHGSPSFPYIYNKTTRELEVDETKVELYRFILDKALQGETCNNISYQLNKMGITTVKRNANWGSKRVRDIVLDRTHLGEVKFEGTWYKGNHKPLKTQEEQETLVLILKGNKMIKTKKLVKHEYVLSNIVKCGICGMGMSYMDKKLASGEVVTYIRNCWYKDAVGNKCNTRSIRSDIVIDEINHHIDREIERLNDLIQNNVVDESSIKQLNSELSLNKKSLEQIDKRKGKILDMTEAGLYTVEDAKIKIGNLQEEMLYLQCNINNLQKEIDIHNSNYLEVKRDKLTSIQSVISTTENKTEINKLYKTILKGVKYTRIDDCVNIEVEFL